VRAFRNALITVGAAFGAGYVVSALRWWLLYPLTGLGVAGGSSQTALAWAIGAGGLAAVLAGVAAGIAVQTDRPTGWSLLLAALVGSSSGTRMKANVFPDALSLAAAEFAASITVAAIAFGVFYVARNWFSKRVAIANAR
jgi:hypothetical protein